MQSTKSTTIKSVKLKIKPKGNGGWIAFVFIRWCKFRWLILGEEPMWHPQEVSYEPGNPEKDSDDDMKSKMINLLETKVRVLAREIKRLDPDLARELGLD